MTSKTPLVCKNYIIWVTNRLHWQHDEDETLAAIGVSFEGDDLT